MSAQIAAPAPAHPTATGTTPGSGFQPRRGQMSVCACGAESPAMEPDALDAWEDDHTQWDCTAVEPRTWDEQLEQWTFPGLPAITRHDADITPEPVTPAPTCKDTTKHIWRPM